MYIHKSHLIYTKYYDVNKNNSLDNFIEDNYKCKKYNSFYFIQNTKQIFQINIYIYIIFKCFECTLSCCTGFNH